MAGQLSGLSLIFLLRLPSFGTMAAICKGLKTKKARNARMTNARRWPGLNHSYALRAGCSALCSQVLPEGNSDFHGLAGSNARRKC